MPSSNQLSSERSLRWPLLLVVALGAALRFYQLGDKSVWLDESFSITLAGYPVRQFMASIRGHEMNMSLYFTLLKAWLLFGDSEFWVRALSASFGVLAITSVYRLGTRLFGVGTGLIAALLFALHPFAIEFAQEARSYSLLLWLSASGTLAYLDVLHAPSRSRHWVKYVALMVLACYAHYFAFLTLVVHGLYMMKVRLWRSSPREFWSALLSGVFLLAPLLHRLMVPVGNPLGWVAPLSFGVLKFEVLTLAGGKPLFLAYAAAATLAVAHGCRKGENLTTEIDPRWATRFAVMWLFLPVLLVAIASLKSPMFVSRYLIVCTVPSALLVARGTMLMPELFKRGGRVSLVLVTFVVCGLSVRRDGAYFRDRRESTSHDWRAVARLVLDRARPSDGILVYPNGPFPLTYSAHRESVEHGAPPLPAIVYPNPRPPGGDNLPILTRTNILGRTGGHDRVWLVLNLVNDQDPEVQLLTKTLAERYPHSEERRIGTAPGAIDARLYASTAQDLL